MSFAAPVSSPENARVFDALCGSEINNGAQKTGPLSDPKFLLFLLFLDAFVSESLVAAASRQVLVGRL